MATRYVLLSLDYEWLEELSFENDIRCYTHRKTRAMRFRLDEYQAVLNKLGWDERFYDVWQVHYVGPDAEIYQPTKYEFPENVEPVEKSKELNDEDWDGIEQLYFESEIPGYLEIVDRYTIKFKAGADWQGYSWHTLTPEDVLHYYAYDANNIVSGMRSLGSINGDWRNIDAMAQEVLAIFKVLDAEYLEDYTSFNYSDVMTFKK